MWGVLQPPSPEVLSLQLEMYRTSHRKRWIPLSSSAVCWPLMCLCASRPGTRSLFWKPFQHHVMLPRDIQHSSPQPFHSLHGVFQFAQSVGDVSLIHPLISVTAHFAFLITPFPHALPDLNMHLIPRHGQWFYPRNKATTRELWRCDFFVSL